MGNLVDATTGTVHSTVFVALPRVAPVENVSAAIRAGRNFHAPEPRVGTDKLIRLMTAHITSAQPFEPFNIGTATVQIEREQPIAERFGKLIPLIDHHAAMGMTTTEIVGLAITAILPAPLGIKMIMIRNGIEALINGGIDTYT